MKSKDATEFKAKREEASLDGRYGKIGIPAVVAAVAYKDELCRDSDAALTERAKRWEQWLLERAAA
jgi:hypothetical protein